MLSCLASGKSVIRNYLPSDDCNRTIEAFTKIGAEIKIEKENLYVNGVGLKIPN
jgi:3-phosphoshikimate 1-carboxyvinyltransferase